MELKMFSQPALHLAKEKPTRMLCFIQRYLVTDGRARIGTRSFYPQACVFSVTPCFLVLVGF